MAHHAHSHDAHRADAHGAAAEVRVRDPVCGMEVDPATAKHRAEHAGKTYYFCCAGCGAKFAANPQAYVLERAPPSPVNQPAGIIYTCPMHPQIRSAEAGACPICGMALEPLIASADPGANPELADMRRRFWIGAVLAAPVVLLEMGGHLFARRPCVPVACPCRMG